MTNVKNPADLFIILKKIFSVSIVVAVIAILETIISAQIAQSITKDKYSKQKEVFGLAMANIASGLF
jgi:MFS superfamily sulfate permease-like transporter